MKLMTLFGCATVVSLAMGGLAQAKNDKPAKAKVYNTQVAAKCPPGLAKKSPACVPPGQAKKSKSNGDVIIYRAGDIYRSDYPVVRDYDRYGLPRLKNGKRYYRVGDNILAVDDNTRLVLDIISVASRLSN